jgi:hypothetical protein
VVDTVNVDVIASMFVEMLDPNAVEKLINCVVAVDAFSVDTILVDVIARVLVEIVEPISVE